MNALKLQAARKAVEFVEDGMAALVGLDDHEVEEIMEDSLGILEDRLELEIEEHEHDHEHHH